MQQGRLDLFAKYLGDVKRKKAVSTYNAYKSILGAFFSRYDVLSFKAEDLNRFLDEQKRWSN